ncbi:MAG: [Fe-Fe] hydrogenase large subunit C-terminal domain-containing protein [Bacillota bacterium]
MAIIETVRTKCRDCYKCLRACPVKAIKVSRGPGVYEMHASVVEEFCIHDGTCIRECPQKAKKVRSDLNRVRELLSKGEEIAVSLAPSFAAALPLDDPLRVVTALRKMGVAVVQETALGAEMVASLQRKLLDQGHGPMISSSCPAVVSLIEKHYPEAIRFLSPAVSPAVAHGRYLKAQYPGIRVVFIGPCIAKKDEICDPEVSDSVDVALTFQELLQWVDEAHIPLSDCAPGSFDPPLPSLARLFPADGGLLRSCQLDGVLNRAAMSVSGVDRCREVINHFLKGETQPQLVELMACPGGCISGPFALGGEDYYQRRNKLLTYVAGARTNCNQEGLSDKYLELLPPERLLRKYRDKQLKLLRPTREQLREILEKSGKFSPEDELNCGACGYQSCEEKAIAVFNGMADPEMCIPHMRQLAESMANVVVSATPDGIVVVSSDGLVVDMNAAAERILGLPRKNAVGLPIGRLMDDSCFRQAADQKQVVKGECIIGDRVVEQQVLYVGNQKLCVGFLMDVTEERRAAQRQREIREEAVRRAQQVIAKQMQVVQKIAGLLGETTAETKLSLTELMKVVREEIPPRDATQSGSGSGPVE